MVAWAGVERLLLGLPACELDAGLATTPRPPRPSQDPEGPIMGKGSGATGDEEYLDLRPRWPLGERRAAMQGRAEADAEALRKARGVKRTRQPSLTALTAAAAAAGDLQQAAASRVEY